MKKTFRFVERSNPTVDKLEKLLSLIPPEEKPEKNNA
jgi:hypothetical protein